LQRLPRGAAWALVFGWFAMIWWFSSRPGVIVELPWYMPVLQNLAHAPLFGLLGMWIVLLVERRDGWPDLTRARWLAVLAGVLAFGVADELHQHFTPQRSMSLCDLLTDVTGASAVLAVVHHLASASATTRSLVARLACGLLACIAAAFNATFLPSAFPSARWL
jgi:VanZ family protein